MSWCCNGSGLCPTEEEQCPGPVRTQGVRSHAAATAGSPKRGSPGPPVWAGLSAKGAQAPLKWQKGFHASSTVPLWGYSGVAEVLEQCLVARWLCLACRLTGLNEGAELAEGSFVRFLSPWLLIPHTYRIWNPCS